LEGDAQDLGATAEADLLLLDGLAHQPGQAVLDTIDAIIDDFRKDISKVGSFDDASNRILNRHKRQFKQRSKLAQILDNLRYVAASAGTSNAKK